MSATSTILVVDDDLQLRRFLRTTLSGHYGTVVEAGTVAEAIDAIHRVHPAVVLLDLGLPGWRRADGSPRDPRGASTADHRAVGPRPGGRQGRPPSMRGPRIT